VHEHRPRTDRTRIVTDPSRDRIRLVLASASSGRLSRLRAAGLEPDVVVSGVPEDEVTGTPAEIAATLAARKARAVAGRIGPDEIAPGQRILVLGCDSLLELDGEVLGKPRDAADAVARWVAMRGRTGTLLTGHCLIDLGTAAEQSEVASTTVRFGSPDDDEIDAYVRSGEPLRVAGAFTVDGLGGWFLDGVDGDPSNVIGVSLPTLRGLLRGFGVRVPDLWPHPGGHSGPD
jgi:septum formation protein